MFHLVKLKFKILFYFERENWGDKKLRLAKNSYKAGGGTSFASDGLDFCSPFVRSIKLSFMRQCLTFIFFIPTRLYFFVTVLIFSFTIGYNIRSAAVQEYLGFFFCWIIWGNGIIFTSGIFGFPENVIVIWPGLGIASSLNNVLFFSKFENILYAICNNFVQYVE